MAAFLIGQPELLFVEDKPENPLAWATQANRQWLGVDQKNSPASPR